MKPKSNAELFHVLDFENEFQHKSLRLEELKSRVHANSVTRLLVFRATSFTTIAKSDTDFCLTYGFIWNNEISRRLNADDFLSKIVDTNEDFNGQYIVVKWDKTREKLIVKTDFYGTRSLYVFRQGSSFIIAQEERVLRELIAEQLSIDKHAFAISMSNVLPTPSPTLPTLVKNVQRLGGNCTLQFQNGTLSDRHTIDNIPDLVRGSMRPYEHETSNTLLRLLRESLFDDLTRISSDTLSTTLDLSGGLDSGVLLGIQNSLGLPPDAINSLICKDILKTEHSNIEQWKSYIEDKINYVYLPLTADSYISEIQSNRYLDVLTPGIIHLNELTKAASKSNTKLRLVGFGPDEFMTNPLKTALVKPLLLGAVSREHRGVAKNLIYELVTTHFPSPIARSLCARTTPDYFSVSTKKVITDHKLSAARYVSSIKKLGTLGSRVFNINLYQQRTQQLTQNDQLSIEKGMFCYYPYLNKKTLTITYELAARNHLSKHEDSKYYFRKCMKDLLPNYLQNHAAKNEDFTKYNQAIHNDFLDKTKQWKDLKLAEYGFIDQHKFRKMLEANEIATIHLSKVYAHEAFLRSL